jgi:hypothetical protein
MTFIADKRPYVFSGCYVNNTLDIYGRDPRYVANPAWLVNQVRADADYCKLARRMAGMVQGSLTPPAGTYPASNWGILTPAHRAYWESFRALPHEEWILYSGRLVPDSFDQSDATNNFANPNDWYRTEAAADFIKTAVQPYFDRGFTEFGLDASGEDNPFTDLVASKLALPSRKPIIQEAYPLINAGPGNGVSGRRWELNLEEMVNRPYLAISWGFNRLFDPDDEWVIPKTDQYEVHVSVGFESGMSPSEQIEYYESLHDRGFIVGPSCTVPIHILDWVRTKYQGGVGARVRVRPPSLELT